MKILKLYSIAEHKLYRVIRGMMFSAIVLGVCSCSDYLDTVPHSAASPESVTEDDLPALRVGMYNNVQNRPTRYSYIIYDILGGQLATSSGNPTDLINSTLNPLSSVVSNCWSGYFRALYQVNNVLGITDAIAQSEIRNLTKGEAHYFRAYIYSKLVTSWGAVPILRANTMAQVVRDPIEDVWKFIEEDLNSAIELLGGSSSSSSFYVSRSAALALKARVMLYQGKMSEAAQIAESLITSGSYKLDSFDKIFRNQTNSEVIFSFQNLSEESSNTLSTLFYSYAHPNKGSWVYKPTEELMQLYESGDLRKNISITTVGGNDMVNKYPSGQTGTDPIVISRLSEMYLISAEAQGRVNGLARLNELRNYRGLARITPGNDEAFLNAILLERKKEFLGECFLYYDLVRTNRAESEIGLLEHQHVLPIPGKELLLNPNLEPNPGY